MLHSTTDLAALLQDTLALRDEAEALAADAEAAGDQATADAYWDEANALIHDALAYRQALRAQAA